MIRYAEMSRSPIPGKKAPTLFLPAQAAYHFAFVYIHVSPTLPLPMLFRYKQRLDWSHEPDPVCP